LLSRRKPDRSDPAIPSERSDREPGSMLRTPSPLSRRYGSCASRPIVCATGGRRQARATGRARGRAPAARWIGPL